MDAAIGMALARLCAHAVRMIAFGVLANSCFAQEGKSVDIKREVLTVVLRDFHARKLEPLPLEPGILLVHRHSSVLKSGNLRSFMRPPSQQTCKLPSELQSKLIQVNSQTTDAEALVVPTKNWRLIDKSDEDGDIGEKWHLGPKRGERVKTILSVWRPAISADANLAFVYFSFLWSIHGADAHYLLERKGKGWRVNCTEFFFYP